MLQVDMIKSGDLLNAYEDVIVQQCNCLAVRPYGLSKSIADKFEHGDHYASRRGIGKKNLSVQEDRDEPGTTVIIEGKPYIACIMGQWQMGKNNSSYYRGEDGINNYSDTRKNREIWFKHGLSALGEWCMEEGVKSVAFPYMIGCGLAGGNWKTYLEMIIDFQRSYPKLKVVIYKLCSEMK